MNTRCKPGDLAVVVRARTPGMVGRMVIVERLADEDEFIDVAQQNCVTWIISSAVHGELLPTLVDGVIEFCAIRPFSDLSMRPIRPNEGEDESLSWAEKPPSKIKQPA